MIKKVCLTMDLQHFDSKLRKSIYLINSNPLFSLLLGTALIFSLLVSKAPFGFIGFTGADIIVFSKVGIAAFITIPSVVKKGIVNVLPFSIMIFFLFLWKTSEMEYYFIYFEIVYLFIVSYWIIKNDLKWSIVVVLLIITLIMVVMQFSGQSFAPENTGPGKYIIFGSTTAVRIYGVLLFGAIALICYGKNYLVEIFYSVLAGYFSYAILISVSKIGWISLVIFTIILFIITIKYKKLYCAYACVLIAFIASYSNGYFDILTNRIVQSSSVNIFLVDFRGEKTGGSKAEAVLIKKIPPIPAHHTKVEKGLQNLVNEDLIRQNTDKQQKTNDKGSDEQKIFTEIPLEKVVEEKSNPLFDRLAKLDKTGRVEMYRNSFELFEKRPLLGYVFSDTEDKIIFFSRPNGHPHNLLIEILLRFGIFGLLIILMIFYKSVKYCIGKSKLINSIILSSIIYFFILSLTNGDIVDNRFLILMPLLIKNIDDRSDN